MPCPNIWITNIPRQIIWICPVSLHEYAASDYMNMPRQITWICRVRLHDYMNMPRQITWICRVTLYKYSASDNMNMPSQNLRISREMRDPTTNAKIKRSYSLKDWRSLNKRPVRVRLSIFCLLFSWVVVSVDKALDNIHDAPDNIYNVQYLHLYTFKGTVHEFF